MSKSFKSLPDQSASPVDTTPNNADEPMYRDPKRENSGTVYLWLLVLSVCFSAVISWLYVTKPVIVASEAEVSKETLTLLGAKQH